MLGKGVLSDAGGGGGLGEGVLSDASAMNLVRYILMVV